MREGYLRLEIGGTGGTGGMGLSGAGTMVAWDDADEATELELRRLEKNDLFDLKGREALRDAGVGVVDPSVAAAFSASERRAFEWKVFFARLWREAARDDFRPDFSTWRSP